MNSLQPTLPSPWIEHFHPVPLQWQFKHLWTDPTGQNKPFFFIYDELFAPDILVTETQKSLIHQRLLAATKLGLWTRLCLWGHFRPFPSRVIGFCCYSHSTNVTLLTAALVNWLIHKKNWLVSRNQSNVWWCLPQRQRRSYGRGEQRILTWYLNVGGERQRSERNLGSWHLTAKVKTESWLEQSVSWWLIRAHWLVKMTLDIRICWESSWIHRYKVQGRCNP